MSDKGDGLAFEDSEVDIAKYPIVLVFERYIVETDFVVERVDRLGVRGFGNGVLSIENSVDALERSHAFLDAITSARELFERIDNAIENDEIVDKFGSGDATIAREDEVATIPKEDGNYGSAEKFANRVGEKIAGVYAIEGVADSFVERLETLVEFLFCIEGFDYS